MVEVEGGIAPFIVYGLVSLYLTGTVAAVSQGKNPHTNQNL